MTQSWWDRVDQSPAWQEAIPILLSLQYTALAIIALIQLVRIQQRVPEYGWTTQKVFHLFNLLVGLFRAATFALRHRILTLSPPTEQALLLDLPGVLFFTTYSLLVLFWAEIYHQARGLPSSNLRPTFVLANGLVYMTLCCMWVFGARAQDAFVSYSLSTWFMSCVCMAAAGAFLIYGGRLFLMLKRFPIESRGRRKKLREVGLVTVICTICFALRSLLLALSARAATRGESAPGAWALDALNHPLLNLLYYMTVEIVPMALVLFILRKLPPKRPSGVVSAGSGGPRGYAAAASVSNDASNLVEEGDEDEEEREEEGEKGDDEGGGGGGMRQPLLVPKSTV